MSSGVLRRWCLGAGVLLGFLASGHAGPTRLDDAPAKVDEGAAPPPPVDGSSTSPGANVPARTRRDAIVSIRGDNLLRQDDDSSATAPQILPRQESGLPGADSAARVPGSSDEGFSIRSLAKSAHEWAHDLVPWGSRPPVVEGASARQLPENDLILPIESAGSASAVFAVRVQKALPSGNATLETRDRTTPAVALANPGSHLLATDPQSDNAIRRAVNFGRAVIAHPLTWIAVVVIAVAQILLARASRRRR